MSRGGFEARLARLEGARGNNLPRGCRSAAQWRARLAKHRALCLAQQPSDALGELFPAGTAEVVKWGLELVNGRIAAQLVQLRARDWTKREPGEVKAPAPLVEKVKNTRQAQPEVDRLADYRDKRDVVIPEPEPQ